MLCHGEPYATTNHNTHSQHTHMQPQAEVLFNHVVELLCPFFLLVPYRPTRLLAASLLLFYMAALGLGGNYAFVQVRIAVKYAFVQIRCCSIYCWLTFLLSFFHSRACTHDVRPSLLCHCWRAWMMNFCSGSVRCFVDHGNRRRSPRHSRRNNDSRLCALLSSLLLRSYLSTSHATLCAS